MSLAGTMVEITDGGNYTAEAGTDRIVALLIICGASTGTNTISSVSFGAQAATLVEQNIVNQELSGIAIVKEADIPAGSNAVSVVLTEDGSEEGITIHCITLTGRDQSATILTATGDYPSDSISWTGTLPSAPSGADVAGVLSSDTPSRYPTSSAAPFTLLDGGNKGTYSGGSILAQNVTAGDADFDVTFNTANEGSWVAAAFPEAGAGPSAPSLDTIPSTAFPGQSRTVSGSGFGATQGTGGLTIGGVSQTITSWSDTSITFTTVLGANSYGTGKVVELTTDAGGTDTGAIELVANTAGGFGVVTMSSPNTTDESSVAFGATPTVVTGDQFEWEDFNALGNLAIGPDAFVSSVDTEGTFRGRFWDASDGTWGGVNTFTASATDETAPTISSASVPTAGNNIAVQMDESMQVGAGGSGGWTISLGDATVTSAAVDGSDDTIINLTPSRTLTDEDTFTIGYTQPGNGFQDQADTPNDLATLSGQAVTNNSTQEPPAADTTPDAFSFTDQTGVEPESVDESNAITITGVDAGEDIAVTITGGQYAVSTDGGSSFGGWTSAGTNVQLNHQIKVRNTASSEFSTAANTTLTAGGVSDTFTRTTRAAVLPTLDTPIPDLDLGETDAVNLDLDDHFSGASSYTLTGIPTDSGLSFSGSVLSGNVNKDDIAASPFNLTATAFSADGSIQDVFEVVVVDDIVPVISINSLTTTDTTPVVTGSAGDATSLTLVVNSVTYNPTPSGGTWSQQLPELALDTYPMTLNGQDAAGNDAVEATAVLTVVDEIVAAGNGLFRPLFRANKKSTFKNLFR